MIKQQQYERSVELKNRQKLIDETTKERGVTISPKT